MWPFSRVPRTAYPVPRTAYRFKNTRIFIVKQYLSYCFTTNILPKTIWILVNTEGRRRGEGKSHLRQGYGGQRKGRRGVFASRHYAFTPLRHCAITPLRLYAFLIPAPSPLSPSLSPRPNVSAFQALPAADEPGLSFRLPGLKRLTVC